MALAVVRREDNSVANDESSSSRERMLARYRQLRDVSKQLHSDILKLVSADAMLHQARRLGVARGKTLILDNMHEMNYVFDLAVYTAPAGRSRAIDRYARSAQFAAGSDEALVLEAMGAARFAILAIERRHETVGLIATDVLRRTKIWLVDLGLESSIPDGALIASRIYCPERFSMTAGANVPFDDPGILGKLQAELPRNLVDRGLPTVIDDRRFAEATYRIALADGATDRIAYQDLPGES